MLLTTLQIYHWNVSHTHQLLQNSQYFVANKHTKAFLDTIWFILTCINWSLFTTFDHSHNCSRQFDEPFSLFPSATPTQLFVFLSERSGEPLGYSNGWWFLSWALVSVTRLGSVSPQSHSLLILPKKIQGSKLVDLEFHTQFTNRDKMCCRKKLRLGRSRETV